MRLPDTAPKSPDATRGSTVPGPARNRRPPCAPSAGNPLENLATLGGGEISTGRQAGWQPGRRNLSRPLPDQRWRLAMTARRSVPTTTVQLLAPPPPARPGARHVDAHEIIDLTLRADNRLLLSVEEAAERLGIGRSLMYELISGGQVASIRVGRLRRIAPEALPPTSRPSTTATVTGGARHARQRAEASPMPSPKRRSRNGEERRLATSRRIRSRLSYRRACDNVAHHRRSMPGIGWSFATLRHDHPMVSTQKRRDTRPPRVGLVREGTLCTARTNH
jgi:excisionase family DNA binding protein